MSLPRSKAWAGIASGATVFAATFAAAIDPPPVLTVSEWAEKHRMVSAESGSPYPGKWHNELVPYGVEIMDCLSFSDPCRDVTFKKSHQVGGTEIGVNLFGYGTAARQRSPRFERPRRRVILVEAPVSSMNTSRRGSRSGCWTSQASGARRRQAGPARRRARFFLKLIP